MSRKCPKCGRAIQAYYYGGTCTGHDCFFSCNEDDYMELPLVTDDADLYRLPEKRHEMQAAAYSPNSPQLPADAIWLSSTQGTFSTCGNTPPERRLEPHNFEHWRHARPVDITVDKTIKVHAVRPCKRCMYLTDIDQLSGTGYCPKCVGEAMKESERAHLEDSRLVVLLLCNLLATLKERHIDHISVGEDSYTVHLRKKEG